MVPFRSSEHGAESGTEELNSEASTSAQVGFETGFEAARSEFLDDALKNALDEICEDRESASASEGVVSGPTAPYELGHSQVPRGPKLDRSSMDQLFTSAFVNTRKRLQVEMPWEKGVAKRIFSRGLNLPKPLQGLHSVGWTLLRAMLELSPRQLHRSAVFRSMLVGRCMSGL